MIRVVHGTKSGACFVSGNYRKKQDIQGAFGCVMAGQDVSVLAHESITKLDNVFRSRGGRREWQPVGAGPTKAVCPIDQSRHLP